jgi:hypothetical protein
VDEKGETMKQILFLIALILIAGCTSVAQMQINEPKTVPSIEKINLKTDKDLYHSGEIIHIEAKISSEMALSNATVRFYGIYASRYRLDQTKTSDLTIGENIVILDFTAPRCYGCAGISPGTYQISVDVVYGNETLANVTKDIEIRQ